MHVIQFKSLFSFVLLGIVLAACNFIEQEKTLDQGVVKYKITYNELSESTIPVELLPGLMIFKFNERNTINTISDFLGIFSISIITDRKKGKNITLLKIFDKRYYYQGDAREAACCFGDFGDLVFTKTEEQIQIASLPAQRVKVSSSNLQIEPFDVYYTNAIKSHNTNITTPYEEIDGVLLKFNLKLNNIAMEITAENVSLKEVKDDEFEIPSNYKPVSREQMSKLINALME